jgi:hypothetical protein
VTPPSTAPVPSARRRVVAGLAAVLVVAGCTPTATDTLTGTETTAPSATAAAPAEDPRRDALLAAVADLLTTVDAATSLLAEAADSGDPATAERAVATLTADEDLAAGAERDVAPLLPGPETSRQETVDYGDAFTTTLEAARDGSGALAADVSRVLSDTIAGDLGAWQRDAAGVLDTVDQAARGDDVTAAEPDVLAIPGEGTRALAWALLASRADAPETVAAAAERGIAHLDLIRFALTELTDTETDEES